MKIRNVCKYFIVLCLLSSVMFSASVSLAQEELTASVTPIEVKKELSDSLAPGKHHTYTLTLQPDQFVYGEVNQISVDVVVTVKDPAGKILQSIDGPAQGPEFFQFESKTEGVYTIEVKSFKEEAGRYTILLKGLEPIAENPSKRVDQLMILFTGTEKPGAAVAVVKKGKVIFSKAYGMANLTYGIPFTTETPNNIGSTSKQFTAFAVCLLAKQGKLSLDDDVRTHIPELPDFGKTVTLRNLLTHTSGYREFLNLIALDGRNLNEGDYIHPDEIIEIIQKQPALQNDPGAEWNYNNTGYSLLATVVKRVSEQPFPEWMEEHVFKPLNMTRTVIRAHPRQIIPYRSQGYMPDKEGGYQIGRDLASSMGAGGIYSTVGDLAKWMNNLRTGTYGGKDIIKQMTTRYVLTSADTTDYGFGLFIDQHRGLKRIQHGGADIAHRSMQVFYPEIDAGVITQSNNASFPGTMANKIAEAFFEEHMEPEKAEKEEPSEFDPADYDPENFDELAGRYELEEVPGFVLTFTREDDTFYTQATGQEKAEIVPTSDSTFKLLVVEASVTFHCNQEDKVESLTLHQNGDHKAKRLLKEPWKPNQEKLQEYTGKYFSKEIETFYYISFEDSSLLLKNRRLQDLTLTPAQTDTFTSTYPINELIFIRNDAGEAVGLKVSNGRTRGVEFEKTMNNE
ncbi:MAG: serine hydrolase [bacterium]